MNRRPAAVAAALLVLFLIFLAGGAGCARLRVTRPPIPWYFSIHGGEVGHDGTKSEAAFQKVLDLGGKGVRTDIFWAEVEPARDAWNDSLLDFYSGYVTLARSKGLDPMMIVSGAPGWAIELHSRDPKAFWKEYEEYVERVVRKVGDRVGNYQVWNEANHFIDPIDAADDWELFSRAGAIFRRLDPTATLYVNVNANWFGWEDAVTDWVSKAGSSIDVIGVDHYPGTWSPGSNSNWYPLERLVERINTPGDPWYGKKGAVLETGYSSWAPVLADEEGQKRWINESIPALHSKVREANRSNKYKVVLANYYLLLDPDTNGWGPEPHFGILHTDSSPKLGYDDLKRQITGLP
ncbi:MAG: hypothetical protein HY720_04675 [Planctomycetes bacterium]|nr:hypothetical protein [Planctomycetota bacterium]